MASGTACVAEHLAQVEGQDSASLVWQPADEFRAALRRLMAAEGIEDAFDPKTSSATMPPPSRKRPIEDASVSGDQGDADPVDSLRRTAPPQRRRMTKARRLRPATPGGQAPRTP